MQIKVRGMGEDLHFKVRTTTRLDKVFQVYAQRKGLDLEQLRFSSPGSAATLSADDAAGSLADGATIDARA